jgi:CheY-like chemotaxis protein
MEIKQQTPSLKILLADDDIDDRFFFAKALNELSLDTHLTTVHDGEQLMDYLSEHLNDLPDVLFLDLSMPRKSGFECLAEIKEHAVFKDIPVVMFSTSYPRDSNYEESMIQMLFNIGANDFIRKPNDFLLLKDIILKSLNKVIDNKALSKEEGRVFYPPQ